MELRFYSSKPMPTKKSIISKYLAQIGAKGGKAGTGKSKSRGSDHARKAAMARWTKAKKAEGKS